MADTQTGAGDNIEQKIKELIDKQELRDLVSRYARAVDRDDWDTVKTCFTDDATDNHGVVVGSINDLATQAKEHLSKYWGVMHCLCQHYSEIEGDNARGETYALTTHRRNAETGDGEEDTFSGLRYLDRYQRIDGKWKIAERVTTLEWCTTVPTRNWLPIEKFVTGKRDETDISYSFGFR
jgi:ketosteroid isomerase-like protein